MMFTKPSRVPNKADLQKKVRATVNKKRSAEFMKGITEKLIKREEMKRRKIASLGIDYDFPGHAGIGEKEKSITDKNQSVNVETEETAPTKKPKSKKKSKKKTKNEPTAVTTTVASKKKKSKTKHMAVK